MKVHGWCASCRRVRRVQATAADLARAQRAHGGVVVGTCDECAEAADPPRRR